MVIYKHNPQKPLASYRVCIETRNSYYRTVTVQKVYQIHINDYSEALIFMGIMYLD